MLSSYSQSWFRDLVCAPWWNGSREVHPGELHDTPGPRASEHVPLLSS